MLSQAEFIDKIDQLQALFDDLVDAGTDQELFISGYLNGHFSLAASQCLNANTLSLEDLNHQLLTSLDTAFSQHELEPDDQTQVRTYWAQCLAKL